MLLLFVFASRRRHTIWPRDWSSDVCSSDLARQGGVVVVLHDLALAARYCDRLVLLQGGRVVAEGSAGQVLSADQQIGRASCRERESIWGVGVTDHKQRRSTTTQTRHLRRMT